MSEQLTKLRRQFDELMAEWQDVEWQQSKRWEDLMRLRRNIVELELRPATHGEATDD